ncbi:hypothetical protein [Spirulina sp. 06S082]|uniref:hypothetical protein n=1 Tax=Spirulina sp. 06S082 TaxID=3110248 RepID=UPI002B21F46F|nr:hypothetical protein [Spirulina sp. 06S082]MEA5469933.1 hypothetical protein [Spirulina sp. 06S082]
MHPIKMLPTLEDFGISPPVYIRKINSRSSWKPDPEISDPRKRLEKIAEASFDETSSIWLVNSEQDFYSVIASLSANRTSRHQDIDFIWLTDQELDSVGIQKNQVMEGRCLFAQKLHYDIEIKKESAIQLCDLLKQNNRQSLRCKKKQTKSILIHQEKIGCKALNDNQELCQCQLEGFV